jgi:hypothetical protein
VLSSLPTSAMFLLCITEERCVVAVVLEDNLGIRQHNGEVPIAARTCDCEPLHLAE